MRVLSPGAQPSTRRRGPGVWAWVVLLLVTGCATGRPLGGGVPAFAQEGWAGWRDGVGRGRDYAVPMSLDYFQGFLVQTGVPEDALPGDGRTLAPEQALSLVPHLLNTSVTLGNLGPRRMAAHLLLEVATGGREVPRQELHARMDRFHRLLVLRPDGYLVHATTGRAVQRAGEVGLAEDGALRAGRFEVGPFYAIEGGRLFPVDERLEVPSGARPAGLYEPDDGVLLPALEGAGAVKAASWGGKLGHVTLPFFSLTGEGVLAVRLVSVPVGTVATATGQTLSATYVLHMATTGAGGGGSWKPPLGGPGKWVRKNEGMKPRARKYQFQISGKPEGWAYRVWRNGKKADFDDYKNGILLDAKGLGYDKFFDKNLKPRFFFQGAREIVERARRQLYVANGISIRWHVAEPRMVAILKQLFEKEAVKGIEVVYTQMLPGVTP